MIEKFIKKSCYLWGIMSISINTNGDYLSPLCEILEIEAIQSFLDASSNFEKLQDDGEWQWN